MHSFRSQSSYEWHLIQLTVWTLIFWLLKSAAANRSLALSAGDRARWKKKNKNSGKIYLFWEGSLSPGTWPSPWQPESWCWLCWRSCPSSRSRGKRRHLRSRRGWTLRQWRAGTYWAPCQCPLWQGSPSAARGLWAWRGGGPRWPGLLRFPKWTEWLQNEQKIEN